MAKTWGLNAVHLEPIRRIARRVQESPGAGRYLAVGASAALRGRTLDALRSLLGNDERVVGLDLSASSADPWGEILASRRANASQPEGTLYCIWGLAAAAGRPGRTAQHPYQQLNLARDAWGASGTHLLVWLEGFGEMDTFLSLAPDLWSHRDAVVWLTSPEDFQATAPSGPSTVDDLDREITRLRHDLADTNRSPSQRVSAAQDLAEAAVDDGAPLLGWAAIVAGNRVLQRVDTDDAGGELLLLNFRLRELKILNELARIGDAGKAATQLLARLGRRDPYHVRITQHEVSRGLITTCPSRALQGLRLLAGAELPDAGDSTARSIRTNLAMALLSNGRVREASSLLERVDGIWRGPIEGRIAASRGDLPGALASLRSATGEFVAAGQARVAGATDRDWVMLLDEAGLSDPTEAPWQPKEGGDGVRALVAAADGWWLRWRRGQPSAGSALDTMVTTATELAGRHEARLLVARVLRNLVDRMDGEAPHDDHALATLRTLTAHVRSEARRAQDHEGAGYASWTYAEIARLQGDTAEAWRASDGTIVAWCRRYRDEVSLADAWSLLARVAPDHHRAVGFAAEAVSAADGTPSILARIKARRAAAEVHRPDPVRAIGLLVEALGLARDEGLAPNELNILHQLAELPTNPDRLRSALDAHTLASARLFPEDEARALLNLVDLQPEGGLATRRLARAAELIEELGPPRLRLRLDETRARRAS